MHSTRVFVADDHPFFRSGVAAWLQQQPGLSFCGDAGSIAAARSAIAELRPDVVLLDLHLADGDGLDFALELGQNFPTVRVLILSVFDEDVFAHRALRVGARGYM